VLGDWKAAVPHHVEAARLKPDYHGAYFNLAFAYRKSGDKKKAMETYQKLAALNPTMAVKLLPLIK
jgi:tetratricopeptide (TPR) repeat protein